jgi:trigger factor
MEYKIEELGALRKKLKIEIPKDVVSKKIKEAYEDISKKLKIPGFRSGKIPQHILEKQVPVHSFGEMFQDLMQEYYSKVLLENKLIPVGTPEMLHDEMSEIKKDAPLSFSIAIDIKPDIDIGEYKGIKVEKREAVVSDGEVNMAMNKVLEAYGHLEPHEAGHVVGKGDFVTMNFEGFLSGQPLEGGNAENYTVRVGSKKMIAGFEDQIVGHVLGEEFEVRTPLPADWNNKLRRISMPLPGEQEDEEVEQANFMVKLLEVKKMVLPELNDAFAKNEGAETVEELRRNVKTNQQAYKEQQDELRIKQELFDNLVKGSEFEPPGSVVDLELKFMIEGTKFQIEQSGMKLEDSGFDEEEAKNEWHDKAAFNTKGYMILEEIANEEKIFVSEADMEGEFKALAEQTKQTIDVVKQKMLNNQATYNHTKSKLRGQKALNFIYSNCEFEYAKMDPEKDIARL